MSDIPEGTVLYDIPDELNRMVNEVLAPLGLDLATVLGRIKTRIEVKRTQKQHADYIKFLVDGLTLDTEEYIEQIQQLETIQ